ncbi:MAG: hypothetical protein ACMZI0_12630 [Symbiopectobacterium sp.]
MVDVKEKLPDAEYTLIYKQQLGLTPLAKQLMDEINAACTAFLTNAV